MPLGHRLVFPLIGSKHIYSSAAAVFALSYYHTLNDWSVEKQTMESLRSVGLPKYFTCLALAKIAELGFISTPAEVPLKKSQPSVHPHAMGRRVRPDSPF